MNCAEIRRRDRHRDAYDDGMRIHPSYASPTVLTVVNARLRRQSGLFDLDIAGGLVSSIEPAGIKPPEGRVIEAQGNLVTESFVNTHLHLDKVFTLTDLGDDALADYSRSLELRTDDPATLANRGITYAKMERYDEALADLNRSQELEPDDANTFYNLACLFSLWGKTDDALAYLKKAIGKAKEYREVARTDKDFDNICDDPGFTKLLGSEPGGGGEEAARGRSPRQDGHGGRGGRPLCLPGV